MKPPSEATIEIHVDERPQVAALIERLNAPQYATREAAVAALARHPAALAFAHAQGRACRGRG